jgi:hypothetical protein
MVLAGDRDRRARTARRRRRKRAIAAARAVAAALVLMQQRIRRPCRQPSRMMWTLLLKDVILNEFADSTAWPESSATCCCSASLPSGQSTRAEGELSTAVSSWHLACATLLAKAKDVADLHGQRQSIFYEHLDETINAILATELPTMRLPVYPHQRQQLAAFMALWPLRAHVRGVFGFIDGIVIATTKPKVSDVGDHVRDFWCERKKTWGINAVGVYNERLEFDAFIVRSGASTHDSTAVGSSWLGEALASDSLPPRTWSSGTGRLAASRTSCRPTGGPR